MKLFIILLIIQHFLVDWIFQARYIAETKTSKISSMIIHGCIIFLGIFPILWFYEINNCLGISILYSGLHCVQDELIWGVLPKLLKLENFYHKKLFYDFIAVDQALHLAILFLIVL